MREVGLGPDIPDENMTFNERAIRGRRAGPKPHAIVTLDGRGLHRRSAAPSTLSAKCPETGRSGVGRGSNPAPE